ncbi:MAG: phenylacetate--CoA ligase family protein [Chloroflexota bacterium]
MDLSIALKVLWLNYRWRRRDGWSRSQLEARQSRSLRRLLEYAHTHSPFYQRFHRGLEGRPLQDLPVLTKALMMENFDALVTDRAIHLDDVEAHVASLRGDERFLGRYWVNATSGSTGHRGVFLFDASEWVAILASFARAHDFTGLPVGLTHRMRMASVASTAPWHMSARAAATLRSWWVPTLRLDASEPLESIVHQINAFQPEMLVAYASMARLLAEEQLSGRLQISPRLIFTSSEVLSAEARRIVEQAWGRRLFDQYAATECGMLAAECPQHRGLHLFEDLVITEVVDQENRPVPPGVYGDKVLITVLFSRTQPLIRYELTDSLKLASDPRPCGRPFALVESIQGRTEEVLYLPSTQGDLVAVQPGIFHHLMDAAPVTAWQVVLDRDGLNLLVSGAQVTLIPPSALSKPRPLPSIHGKTRWRALFGRVAIDLSDRRCRWQKVVR